MDCFKFETNQKTIVMRFLKLILLVIFTYTNLSAQTVAKSDTIKSQKIDTSYNFKVNTKFNFNIDKTFNFNNENFEKVIEIKIVKGISNFNIQIKGQLVFGRMTATLFDPNNKREGGFILQGDDNNKTKHISANGNIVIPKENPIEGKWILKIEAKEAKGQLKIKMD